MYNNLVTLDFYEEGGVKKLCWIVCCQVFMRHDYRQT